MTKQSVRVGLINGVAMMLVALPCQSALPLHGPIDGQVVEYSSGKPIPDAILVAEWEGEVVGIAETRRTCVHVETTVSDGDGRYHFDPWAGPSLALFVMPQVFAYKPGYTTANRPLYYQKLKDSQGNASWIVMHRDHPLEVVRSFSDEQSASDATHPANMYLTPFTGTPQQRYEYLASPMGFGCSGLGPGADAGVSRRNLYPVYKAIFHEAKPLAQTVKQRQTVGIMQYKAANAWLTGEGKTADVGDALFMVPKEICLELDGHEGPVGAIRMGQGLPQPAPPC